jgi:uncharacterized protein (TIGR02996 family)
MSDRAALYAAVCANPDDDTVRLVMADWLEEHGEAKRARLIRARVAYDTTDEADTPGGAFHRLIRFEGELELGRVDWSACDPEVAALFAAQAETERHALTLTAKTEGTPKLRGVSFYGHVRGFLYGVTVKDGETFARHAADIFRAAPITDVRFDNLTPDGAAAVAGSGYLDRVRSLDVQYAGSAGALRVLGAHPHAAGVRSLAFDGGDDPEAVLEELGGAKHFTGLKKLDVMDLDEAYQRNRRVDEAFGGLLRRTKFHGLETISAWGNGLSDETTRALADGKFTKLRSLDLSMNWVTADGAAELARAKNLGGLRHLDLGSNHIEHGNAVGALIASPTLKRLTTLKLDGNQFSGLGPKALPAACRGPTLRALQLNGCNLWNTGAVRLFACPAVRGLWLLDVASCDLDDKAVAALVKSPLDRLAALSLNGNAVTEKGLKALADSELAARLQWLDVSGTKAGAGGVKALTGGANLTNLKTLLANGRGLAQLKKHFGKSVVAEGN